MASNDPSWHQQRELEFVRHFESLLADRRFAIDTIDGRKSITNYGRAVAKSDRSVDVKRRMIELGSSDYSLQRSMPGLVIMQVQLKQTRWFVFERLHGEVRLVCVSPIDDLISGAAPKPLDETTAQKILASIPPPAGSNWRRVPQNIVLMSTSGFTTGAAKLAERTGNRSVILVEPGDFGGWKVQGSADMKTVLEALDPEPQDNKRRRVRDAIESSKLELAMGGINAEKLAARLNLPLDKVEKEVKALADEMPGLAAKRFDGRLVLFRDAISTVPGAKPMPVFDKLKAIFTGGDPVDKKVAHLSERRAAISQQRDAVQDELLALEGHEGDLKEQFKTNESGIIRRRLTTQMVQLRKDIERKAQMLQMLNQQIDVAGGYLHNLELIKQGNSIKLPAGEDMAEYAAQAEEVLAELEAEAQVANEMTGSVTVSGMTEEEQSMYDELMAEIKPKEEAKQGEVKSTTEKSTRVANEPVVQRESATPKRQTEAN